MIVKPVQPEQEPTFHPRKLESPLRMLLRSRLMTALKGIGLLLFCGSAGYWVLGRLHWLGLLEPELDDAHASAEPERVAVPMERGCIDRAP